MKRIIGIGETVYDIIFGADNQPQRAVPGGSTFNALISLGRTLGRKGVPISMLTETGDDHIGQMILQFMQHNHVQTQLVTVNSGTQSHISLAFLDEQRNAQYEFYKDHAGARLDPAKVQQVAMSADDIVLFGSFFAINPVLRPYTRALLQAAHQAGATLYYDINFRASHIKDLPQVAHNIAENMQLATIVRGSTEDFGYLYGTTDPRRIYQEHVRQHCQCLVCTDGDGPVTLCVPNADNPGSFLEASIPSPRVAEVVSTIGAGDNFNAGMLYALAASHVDRSRLATLPYSSPSGPSWLAMIEAAMQFSSHVVGRLDNYVAPDFVPPEL